MRKIISILAVIAAGALTSVNLAFAVFTIEIDEGVVRGIPIAIVPFGGDAADQFLRSADRIISDDLTRTGRFDPIGEDQHLSKPTSAEEIRFVDWQLIKADYVLIGRVESVEDRVGNFRIITRLYDSFEQKQVFGVQFIATADQMRVIAHRIANAVFENITGQKSSFESRIVYTTTIPNGASGAAEHVLYVADYDGFGPQVVLRSEYPILSPSWSPDSTQIAYSELRSSGARIYIQTVATGERFEIDTPQGHNSAPSWSPDGQRLAFANLTGGNSDVYIYSLKDNKITRVTNHRLIDTEPSWSPDGKHIVFTSNRGKDPQIYQALARRDAATKRVTLDGRSNTAAQYSPSGDRMVVITDQGRGSQVGIFDFKSRGIQVISSTTLDDSAKFSPHGDMLIHVVEGKDRYIKILSPDGRVQTRIPVADGLVKQVDWEKSPQ